jgi:hypothetical protein
VAVSYLTVEARPTGEGVRVQVDSSESNAGITYMTKGNGGHTFRTNGFGPVALFLNHVASADRFVQIQGSNGASPSVGTNAGDLDLTPATGIARMSGTQILTTRRTGWAAPTGTPTRTTFATGSVTLPQLAERVKALVDDLTTHGLIGT